MSWTQLGTCKCGEDNSVHEWGWEPPDSSSTSWVVVSEDKKQVTFHPFFSSGTAAAEGDTPLHHNYHYYWEVKILTETYGTDIMVGLATDKVSTSDSPFKFASLLGREGRGATRRDSRTRLRRLLSRDHQRRPRRYVSWDLGVLCVSFYNLRRHGVLYPTVCSTAARSSTRLIYAGSWHSSLLVDAAEILAASVKMTQERLPPGLLYTCRSQFWLTLPSEGCEERETWYSESLVLGPVKMPADVSGEVFPSPYMSGLYVDSVEREYRVVLWE